MYDKLQKCLLLRLWPFHTGFLVLIFTYILCHLLLKEWIVLIFKEQFLSDQKKSIFISQHFDQQIALFDRNKTVTNSLATDKITVSKYGKKKELKQSLGYGGL